MKKLCIFSILLLSIFTYATANAYSSTPTIKINANGWSPVSVAYFATKGSCPKDDYGKLITKWPYSETFDACTATTDLHYMLAIKFASGGTFCNYTVTVECNNDACTLTPLGCGNYNVSAKLDENKRDFTVTFDK
jgi:hypothetical protein